MFCHIHIECSAIGGLAVTHPTISATISLEGKVSWTDGIGGPEEVVQGPGSLQAYPCEETVSILMRTCS